jgi:hypothetical protein
VENAGQQVVAQRSPRKRPAGVVLAVAPKSPRPDAAPKLAQFPSPAPLNEQERLMLAYVRNTPQREIENVIAEKQAFQKLVDSLGVPEEQEKSDR